jgi:hypothetical protein
MTGRHLQRVRLKCRLLKLNLHFHKAAWLRCTHVSCNNRSRSPGEVSGATYGGSEEHVNLRLNLPCQSGESTKPGAHRKNNCDTDCVEYGAGPKASQELFNVFERNIFTAAKFCSHLIPQQNLSDDTALPTWRPRGEIRFCRHGSCGSRGQCPRYRPARPTARGAQSRPCLCRPAQPLGSALERRCNPPCVRAV